MSSPLISVEQLVASPQDWRVLEALPGKDATQELAAFSAGHLPGALAVDLLHELSDPAGPFPYTRPGATQWARTLTRLGLSSDTAVAVHDRGNGIWAARLWWLLRAFGHEHVAVIDGGLQAWLAAGLPLQTHIADATPGHAVARPQAGYFCDLATVRATSEGQYPAQLLNVLRPPVFSGQELRYQRAGHIPGSRNLPYLDLLDPVTGRFKPAAALRATLAPVLNDPRPIITYCGAGITAAGTALALASLGRHDVSVYDGSLNEWTADPSLPLHCLS
ncbi:sulfurtransferase [Pseudomonas putida]